MFETPEKLEKVRKKALTLALENRWIVINANRSIKEVQNNLQLIIRKNMNKDS